MITLSEEEKRILFQLESCNPYGARNELIVLCRYCRDRSKRETAENLLKKLHSISEEDCKRLICDIQRNYHLPWKARTIGEMLAVARQKSGAAKLEGHDIMALERFDPDVRHMIEFEVLSADSTMGYEGDRMRLFLTEDGYRRALENQEKQFIAIKMHANVSCGRLEYDNKNLPVSRSAGLEP